MDASDHRYLFPNKGHRRVDRTRPDYRTHPGQGATKYPGNGISRGQIFKKSVWTEIKNYDGSQVYYYDTETGKVTWERPCGRNVAIVNHQEWWAQKRRDQMATTQPLPCTNGYFQYPMMASLPGPMGITYPYAPYAVPQLQIGGVPGGDLYSSGQPPGNVPAASVPGPAIHSHPILTPPANLPSMSMEQLALFLIRPDILWPAMEWCVCTPSEGIIYYYNTKTQACVWEKPDILKYFEVARAQAYQIAGIAQRQPTAGGSVHGPPAQEATMHIPLALESIAQDKRVTEMRSEQKQMNEVCHHENLVVEKNTQPNLVKVGKNSLPRYLVQENPVLEKVAAENPVQLNRPQENGGEVLVKEKISNKIDPGSTDVIEKASSVRPNDEKKKGRVRNRARILDTPWYLVWTEDGRVFYYNNCTKKSIWLRPDELVGRPDVDKMIGECLGARNPEKVAKVVATSTTTDVDTEQPSPDPAFLGTATSKDETDKEPLAKRSKQTDGNSTDGQASKVAGAEVKAEQGAIVSAPRDMRWKKFKEMLVEKNIVASSSWQRQVSSIVFDPRYLLLESDERRNAFDAYIEELKQKAQHSGQQAKETSSTLSA